MQGVIPFRKCFDVQKPLRAFRAEAFFKHDFPFRIFDMRFQAFHGRLIGYQPDALLGNNYFDIVWITFTRRSFSEGGFNE